MKREIKFRAWDKSKTMFNVDVLAISSCTWDCPDCEKRGVSLAYQPSVEVMQYTGLKDINGKEIYEGDITTGYEEIIGIVFFKDGGFKVTSSFSGIKNYASYDLLSKDFINDNSVEVIGNIYEDKELLQCQEKQK